ncbi:MAG: leucine-rich repeat domain-containing protein [Treponema sp.]|nr:leucine-rich repeat domain-containing protein [Treponema sp.]
MGSCYCEGLASLIIGNGVRYIESYAFEKSKLTEVVIPDSVLTIGCGTFINCALTDVTNWQKRYRNRRKRVLA